MQVHRVQEGVGLVVLVGNVLLFAVCVSRNLMLKVSVLGVLCYHWLGRVAADPKIIGLKVT